MGRTRKRFMFDFRKIKENLESPAGAVADYIFGDEHEDSSTSWLFRKLDRFENGSSWTSDACSNVGEGEATPTSRYVPLVEGKRQSPTCKKALLRFSKPEEDEALRFYKPELAVPSSPIASISSAASKSWSCRSSSMEISMPEFSSYNITYHI